MSRSIETEVKPQNPDSPRDKFATPPYNLAPVQRGIQQVIGHLSRDEKYRSTVYFVWLDLTGEEVAKIGNGSRERATAEVLGDTNEHLVVDIIDQYLADEQLSNWHDRIDMAVQEERKRQKPPSKRVLQIRQLRQQGLTGRQIADKLGISPHTVYNY